MTADYGYLRLRREDYTAAGRRPLDGIVQAGKETTWQDAFVYFKHEEAGIGPKLAGQMIELLA